MGQGHGASTGEDVIPAVVAEIGRIALGIHGYVAGEVRFTGEILIAGQIDVVASIEDIITTTAIFGIAVAINLRGALNRMDQIGLIAVLPMVIVDHLIICRGNQADGRADLTVHFMIILDRAKGPPDVFLIAQNVVLLVSRGLSLDCLVVLGREKEERGNYTEQNENLYSCLHPTHKISLPKHHSPHLQSLFPNSEKFHSNVAMHSTNRVYQNRQD